LNAIQALSQLSYTPGISLTCKYRPTGTAKDIQGYDRSQEIRYGERANGRYLAALYNLDFRLLSSAFGFALPGRRDNNNPLALLASKKAAFA
jgi:hypothetical protein